MSIFKNVSFMNEGEQVEEYLRKKQEKIDAEKDEDERRYGKNREVYDWDYQTRYSSGSRTGQLPIWKVRDSEKQGHEYSEKDKERTDHDPISRNPRFKKTMERQERMDELKKKYPDAVPKNTSTKADEDLAKAKDKHERELNYANKLATKYAKDHKGAYPGEYQVGSPEYAKAADAARRHYRRTHKNESRIFESVQFLND